MYLFFLSLFFIGIIPYLQIVPLDYTVAARWFYFSMIGLFGLMGVVIEDISVKKGYMRVIIFFILVIYFSYLINLTYHRNDNWTNDIKLFTRYEDTDNNFSVEEWLANAYITKKNYPQALIHIQKSVALFPYDNNLATEASIYEHLGNTKMTQQFYQKALKADNYALGKHSDSVDQLLGRYYLSQGNIQLAQKITTQGTNDYPDDASLWTILAVADYKMGDKDGALYAAGKAIVINPSNPIINTLYVAIKNNQPFTLYIK